ncbi:MAG: class I SAM-dependent methyltransferase, partial [Nitrospiraceae bacterium]
MQGREPENAFLRKRQIVLDVPIDSDIPDQINASQRLMEEWETESSGRCLLCGSTDFSPLVTGYDRMQARDEDYVYSRCASCGLVVLTPLPKSEEIPGLYPEHYSPHVGWRERERNKLINRLAIKYFYGVDSLSRSRLLRGMFRALSGRVMKGIREPHGANRLLDVGCGSGNLLARYKALGWNVRGIETSPRACAACRKRGLEVHQGTVFDAPFAQRQFDLILLSHVIEHLLDPIGVLKRVAEFLAPGGKLIVTTPNIHGIGFSMYGSCWYPLDAPR